MDPLATPTSIPQVPAQAPAAAPSIPRNAADARALATGFLMQLESSMALLGTDPEPGSDDGEADSGMDAMFNGLSQSYGMQGLAALLPGLAGRAGAGAGTDLIGQLISSLTGAGTGAVQGGFGALASSAATATATVAQGAKANAQVVARVAERVGVDPVTAVAMMLVESGGNNKAVGDGGTSFGLFQLHEGGMLTAAGLTPEQAFDPETNATVSLKSLAHEWAKGPNRSPGEIAAASQRPADAAGYAVKVNGALAQARALLS